MCLGDGLHPVLAQLASMSASVSVRTDERDVTPLAEEVRHGTDVVLVPVGQYHGLDVVEAVPDRLEVGQDQVDAGMVVLGKEHATVDDEQPTLVLEHRHVAADLTEPAERR